MDIPENERLFCPFCKLDITKTWICATVGVYSHFFSIKETPYYNSLYWKVSYGKTKENIETRYFKDVDDAYDYSKKLWKVFILK